MTDEDRLRNMNGGWGRGAQSHMLRFGPVCSERDGHLDFFPCHKTSSNAFQILTGCVSPLFQTNPGDLRLASSFPSEDSFWRNVLRGDGEKTRPLALVAMLSSVSVNCVGAKECSEAEA